MQFEDKNKINVYQREIFYRLYLFLLVNATSTVLLDMFQINIPVSQGLGSSKTFPILLK